MFFFFLSETWIYSLTLILSMLFCCEGLKRLVDHVLPRKIIYG